MGFIMKIFRKLLILLFLGQIYQVKPMDKLMPIVKSYQEAGSSLGKIVSNNKAFTAILSIPIIAYAPYVYKYGFNQSYEQLKTELPLFKSFLIFALNYKLLSGKLNDIKSLIGKLLNNNTIFDTKLDKFLELYIIVLISIFIGVKSYNFQIFLSQELVKAIENNEINKVKLLILFGANLNGSVYNNLTKPALIKAIDLNRTEIIKILTSKFIKPFLTNKSIANAIKICIDNNKLDLTKLMLQNGIDPNTTINKYPAIIHATFKNKPQSVKLLVEQGAETTIPDQYGKTIYDYVNEKPEIKQAQNVKNILKEYKTEVLKEVTDIHQLIPDLGNIVTDYVGLKE